ncbi:hypothetical protein LCGC14_0790480 [marine sediment metagenome]|uniref:Uncharacterized protein n=2 Tax=root TaxID=1 RepID=A0A0F9PX12_9ZZZZ
MMLSGARQGALSGIRRVIATAMSRDLSAFVLPGPAIARSRGLDLAGSNLIIVGTPRHAGVLIIVGSIAEGLQDAAAVVYAQMPRPRAILALGAGDIAPLPVADVSAPLTQDGLRSGLAELRRVVEAGAFHVDAADFTAAALEVRIEYTCPMHPEVIRDEPGDCPKCGMTLVPRETSAVGHGGHEQAQNMAETVDHSEHAPKSDDSCHAGHDETAKDAAYTCPMHPEVVSDEPGKCPKCGMNLVKADGEGGQGHEGHGTHGGHDEHSSEPVDGIEPHFMSMVELTKDQPRSSDGLQMEWIEAPFGPFFPGLPAGLHLSLTLDGDTVAGSDARSLVGMADLPGGTAMAPGQFVDHLAAMQLSPIAYRALACAAIEDAAGIAFGADDRRARAAAIERERIASHLSWLAEFGVQTGFLWLAGRAGALQLAVQGAGTAEIVALAGPIGRLIRRVQAAPLMRMRLRGIGRFGKDRVAWGPVDRARGGGSDARSDDATLKELGFGIRVRNGGDALARMMLRCDEIDQSIGLIATAGTLAAPMLADVGVVSGEGAASIETPRGAARLTVTLTDGKVTGAELETPSTAHLALIDDLTRQRELGDALVAVGSLDLSPWEMRG